MWIVVVRGSFLLSGLTLGRSLPYAHRAVEPSWSDAGAVEKRLEALLRSAEESLVSHSPRIPLYLSKSHKTHFSSSNPADSAELS